jgi:hypothetical protein
MSPHLLAMCLLAVCAASTAQTPPPKAQSANQATWVCSAFYQPARSIWKRNVQVSYDGQRVSTVQIDGTPVYSFSISGTEILTAVDGERIQLDFANQTWTSDLRGLATAQGRCEPSREAVSPSPG